MRGGDDGAGASEPSVPSLANGFRTTTMRVPSSNTASTFTSRTMSGTPGSTSSDVRIAAPAAAAAISRAPSRAASQTVSAISAVASGTLSRKPRARRARASSAAVKMSNRSRSVGVRRMASRYSVSLCRRSPALATVRIRSERDRCAANASDRRRSSPRDGVAVPSWYRDRMAHA